MAVVFVALVTAGVVRIGLTYDDFWQTWDEPAHIAAGMELLDKGRYQYETFHPPLARLMTAVGPYLAGVRSQNEEGLRNEGQAILFAGGHYERTLRLARMGVLPFFALASLGVFLWAWFSAGRRAAVCALIVLTTLPPILAHSGLATIDMGAATTTLWAFLAFSLWLDRPVRTRSLLLGVTVGLAVAAKFTAVAFLAACGVLTAIAYPLVYHRWPAASTSPGGASARWVRAVAVVATAMVLTIWAVYGFAVGRLEPTGRPHVLIDRYVGASGHLHDTAYAIAERVPIPAPDFWNGIAGFRRRNDRGHVVSFLGEVRTHGWWYYFPVALAVKTPLAALIAGAAGVILVVRSFRGPHPQRWAVIPIASALSVLLVGTQSHVANGTRHVLVVYPLLALLAGYGLSRLWSARIRRQPVGAAFACGLIVWQAAGSFAAHPDYLAYFNAFAGGQPDRIVSDSDLDWGQDLKRLSLAVRERGIERLQIQYNGSAPVEHPFFGLPSLHHLEPYSHRPGWVAVSAANLRVGSRQPPYDQYSWLLRQTPAARIGKSIRLYHFPDATAPRSLPHRAAICGSPTVPGHRRPLESMPEVASGREDQRQAVFVSGRDNLLVLH